jgi:hypothetical protein
VGTEEQSVNPPDSPPKSRDAILVLDAAVGASLLAAAAARMVGRQVRGVVNPVAVVVLRPPMVSEQYHAGTYLDMLARQGVRNRDDVARQVSARLGNLVAPMVAAVLERIDLAKLTEGMVAEVDLAETLRQSAGPGVGADGGSDEQAVGRLRVRFSRRPAPAAPTPAAPPADQPSAEAAPIPESSDTAPVPEGSETAPVSEPEMTSTQTARPPGVRAAGPAPTPA